MLIYDGVVRTLEVRHVPELRKSYIYIYTFESS